MTAEERNFVLLKYMPLIKRKVKGHLAAYSVPTFVKHEDVIQDVVVSFIGDIEGYIPVPGARFRTYAHTVIHHSTVDSIRKHFRRDRRQLLFEPLTPPTKKDPIHEAVRVAVDGLPQHQRTAVLLHYWDGLTQEAVAERLGVTDRSVRTYLSDALEKIGNIVSGLGYLQTINVCEQGERATV